MPTISEAALAFARRQFEDLVENLLDDPSDLLHPWRDAEPAEVISEYRQLGRDLGLDFDALVANGNPRDRQLLASIENGDIKPDPPEKL